MRNVRLIYKKTDRAKYISHLDLNRLMLRVIKRSKLPIWYTEGFNPHPFITFALPLSLGFASEYDVMDFRLADDGIDNETAAKILAASMPDCIKVVEVIDPVLKAKQLKYAEFTVKLCCGENVVSELESTLGADSINVEKKTKHGGVKNIDIKPYIKEYRIDKSDSGASVYLLLCAGCEVNINPMLIFDKISASGFDFDIENVTRGRIFDENMQLFR